MTANNFPFIVSSGPKLQNDPNIRSVIRKQAMKDVGNARRKRGSSTRVHSRATGAIDTTNVPIRSETSPDSSLESSVTDSSDSGKTTDDTDYDELIPRNSIVAKRRNPRGTKEQDAFSFAAINLFSNYETARSKFQIDVVDLTMLTHFHVGRSTIPILAASRANLASLLGYRRWSYLEFVPSRYGSSDCLTAATNCLLAKVKSILAPDAFKCKETVLYLYAKALKTLQDAISDEASCLDSDVLCATQLLSLHELLDTSGDEAWVQHITGSIRLVKNRTPERFETDFDKALFAAHVGPAMTQALIGNTHCYLAQPEWMEIYRSLIVDSVYLHDRSSLTINIRSLMLPLPGLWHDVGFAVNGTQLFDDNALSALKTRCLKLQQDFLNWTEDYKSHCVRLSLSSPPPQELALRRELFGTSCEALIIVKRLLATVSDQDREHLEAEIQALAHLLLELQEHPSPKFSWLFSGHEVGIAYTVMHTKDQWEGPFTYDSEYERRLASRIRFNSWSGRLRRFD